MIKDNPLYHPVQMDKVMVEEMVEGMVEVVVAGEVEHILSASLSLSSPYRLVLSLEGLQPPEPSQVTGTEARKINLFRIIYKMKYRTS